MCMLCIYSIFEDHVYYINHLMYIYIYISYIYNEYIYIYIYDNAMSYIEQI